MPVVGGSWNDPLPRWDLAPYVPLPGDPSLRGTVWEHAVPTAAPGFYGGQRVGSPAERGQFGGAFNTYLGPGGEGPRRTGWSTVIDLLGDVGGWLEAFGVTGDADPPRWGPGGTRFVPPYGGEQFNPPLVTPAVPVYATTPTGTPPPPPATVGDYVRILLGGLRSLYEQRGTIVENFELFNRIRAALDPQRIRIPQPIYNFFSGMALPGAPAIAGIPGGGSMYVTTLSPLGNTSPSYTGTGPGFDLGDVVHYGGQFLDFLSPILGGMLGVGGGGAMAPALPPPSNGGVMVPGNGGGLGPVGMSCSQRFPSRIDVPNGRGGYITYKNMGRCVLFSGDFAAAKRVRKIAGRARRRVGGR